MNNPIDKLLTEWAYRVHDGMPNPSDNYHLVQLEQYLNELRFPRRFKETILNRMRGLKEDEGGGGVTTYPDTKTGRAKAKPGERWKSAKGRGKVYIGPGGDVEGEEKSDGEEKKKSKPNNEMNDDAHREKVKASFAKQREKRRLEKEAMLKKHPEHADKINELHAKVDKLYEDIEAYLSEKDPVKRQKLGEKIFKEHNIAVNKVVEGDSPGDDAIKFYHNDIYGNKDLKNELPPDLYAEIQKRWGKVVPSSGYGHALAMGMQKDGVKVKDPSDMAMVDYKEQNKEVEKLEKRDKKNREALEGGYEVLESIEKKHGKKSENYRRAKEALDKAKAKNKEGEKETSAAKKELKKHRSTVQSALVGNTRRTSKPEMGAARKEIKEDGTRDPLVSAVMGSPPLDRITRDENGEPNSMSGLFGPVEPDPGGDVVSAGTDEGKRKHFEHSVTQNTSLDNTIEELERQRDLGVVGQEIVDTVKNHKKRVEDILRRVKNGELEYPSEEASRLISESYRDMFDELADYKTKNPGSAVVDGHSTTSKENEQPGNSMIANMAEQALYDTELAAGHEVYLPSAGTFPGGDKVKITREGDNVVERAESISVKVGDSGKFYGFPGETKQYQKYHPDKPEQRIKGEPSYRDRHKNNSGEPGFATGIDDVLLSNPKFFNKMLKESGMAAAVTNPKKLQKALDKMSKCIAKATASEGSTTPKNKKAVQKCASVVNKQLSKLFNKDKLEELVGPNNAKLILGGGPDAALILTNMMSFGAIIGTSNGLEGLSHNHMDMETHEQHTEKGTSSLKDYNFLFRHGEASRNGGLTAGFYPVKPKPSDNQSVEVK